MSILGTSAEINEKLADITRALDSISNETVFKLNDCDRVIKILEASVNTKKFPDTVANFQKIRGDMARMYGMMITNYRNVLQNLRFLQAKHRSFFGFLYLRSKNFDYALKRGAIIQCLQENNDIIIRLRKTQDVYAMSVGLLSISYPSLKK